MTTTPEHPLPPGIMSIESDGRVSVRRQARDVGQVIGGGYEAWCQPCGWRYASPVPHHLTPAVDAMVRHNRSCPHHERY